MLKRLGETITTGRVPRCSWSPAAFGRLGGGIRLGQLQIHGPRGAVRHLTVSMLSLQLALAAAVVFLGFFVHAVASAPTVIRATLLSAGHVEIFEARRRFGERFEALTTRYEDLRAVASDLDNRLCKVVLAYGVEGAAADACGQPVAPVAATGATVSEECVRAVRAAIEEDAESVSTRFAGRLAAAVEVESSRPDLVAFTPSASPLRGDDFVLVAPFGETTNRTTGAAEFHYGIDLAALTGTPVRATAAGQVTFAGRGFALGPAWRRYGRMVGIRHGDGGGGFVTVFGHLEATEVRAGQSVARGQRIGTVGATGWSVESNLHYGVLKRQSDGRYRAVDPRIHILDYRWDNERTVVSGVAAAPEVLLPRLPATLLR